MKSKMALLSEILFMVRVGGGILLIRHQRGHQTGGLILEIFEPCILPMRRDSNYVLRLCVQGFIIFYENMYYSDIHFNTIVILVTNECVISHLIETPISSMYWFNLIPTKTFSIFLIYNYLKVNLLIRLLHNVLLKNY